MNYKLALEKLGLQENIDFVLTETSFEMLPKTRIVEQVIQHPEIPEVIGQEAHGIIPATFDASGNELTPMLPAQEFVAAVAYQAAWEETVLVTETYYEPAPSIESLKAILIEDVAIAIEGYLADKAQLRDPEEDSINIVNNQIHSWNFKNIPQPSLDQLYDGYVLASEKIDQEKVNAEARKFLADSDWYVVRFLETQVAIPAEISAERAAARARIQ